MTDRTQHTAGTGIVRERDRRDIRPICQIAEQGLEWDRVGYPLMALWLACFAQAYEATHLA
jgi:hypothetical protein